MFAGHFDDHADALVRCGAHRLIEHYQGFMRSHWTSPLGDYSHRIAPSRPPWSSMAATQQTQKKLLALRYNTILYITAYANLVKKDTEGTLYSSNSKFEFIEIAIDSKKG